MKKISVIVSLKNILLASLFIVLVQCGVGGRHTIPDPSTDPLREESYEVSFEKKKIDEETPRLNLHPNKKVQSSAIETVLKAPPKDVRINAVRRYGAYWSGMHVGDLFAMVEKNTTIDDKGEKREGLEFKVVMRSYNLAKLISKFGSEATAQIGYTKEGRFIPQKYTAAFSRRKEHREISLTYDATGENIIEETNTPPEKRWKRKEVPAELKVGTPDPLTYVMRAREKIRNIVDNGGKNTFTLPFYDGRRKTNYFFTVYGITQDHRVHVTFEEEPVAGYTNNELRDLKEDKPMFTLYLAKHDLLPVWAEGYSPLGRAKIILKKYCVTFEQCLKDKD